MVRAARFKNISLQHAIKFHAARNEQLTFQNVVNIHNVLDLFFYLAQTHLLNYFNYFYITITA